MRQRFRVRPAERYRRVRRILAIRRRRDPRPLVVALIGVAIGATLFVFLLAWVELLWLVGHAAKWLR